MSEMSIKRAAAINASAKYSVLLMNISFSVLLARILSPEDYGIVAIVTIFTTLFSLISDMGFGTAIIQRQDLDNESVCQIYTFTGFLAILSAAIFAVLGVPIAGFYHNNEYKTICLILAVAVFFNTLNMIPSAVLRRDKLFAKLGIRAVVVNIIGYIVAIIMAILGFKYYSLIFQSIIAAIISYFWNKHTANLYFKKRFNINPVRTVWNYSIFQFIFNWVGYFETNLDNILIGGTMGSTTLAYYDRGYRLLSYPANNLSGVIAPVLHPILKDFQDNPQYLLQRYINTQKLLSILAVFIFPICFCASNEIILIFYGQQWIPSIFAFQLLSISIYPKIMMGTTGSVYCSIGNTKLLFIAGFINATFTGICIIGGIIYGSIEAVALGVSIANWMNGIVTFSILIGKGLKVSRFLFFKNFVLDILAMVIITIITLSISRLIFINNQVLLLAVKMFTVLILYIIYLLITRRIVVLIDILPPKITKRIPHSILKFVQG